MPETFTVHKDEFESFWNLSVNLSQPDLRLTASESRDLSLSD